MNKILLENKMKTLERLVLQDIVESYGMQKSAEKSYDLLMSKLLGRVTQFYEELGRGATFAESLSRYGERAEIYEKQWQSQLNEAAKVTVRQIIQKLPKEKLSKSTRWEVIQAVRPVLKQRMEVLSNLHSALALQMQNYMLLWDYQDAGFSHYCLLTEGENCDDCNRLAGRVFPVSEARVGENFAPMHPNCNCRIGILDEENQIVAVIGEGKEHEVAPDDESIKKWLDVASDLLTATSLIPGADTFTNLASIPIDLARGDFLSAGLSAIGAIPVVGEVADTAKLAKTADRAVDAAKIVSGSSKRTNLLSKVSNPKLKNTIKEMYRPGAKVGDGGLADAIRYEIKTGKLVGGKSHIQKGTERLRNLERIFKSKTLTEEERKIIEDLIKDLKRALGGK